MNINKKILFSLEKMLNDGILICAIQFGSSVYSPGTCNDIDIALIVNDLELENFLTTSKDLFCKKYDISLILESEITEDFYFGNHGVYLIEAFKNGILLVGTNIFLERYKQLNESDVEKAVFKRMREYIYILRKSYFREYMDALFLSRYIKFLKLSLFLDGYFEYQNSMKLDTKDVLFFYKDNLNVNLENTSILEKKIILEKIWKRLREKYS